MGKCINNKSDKLLLSAAELYIKILCARHYFPRYALTWQKELIATSSPPQNVAHILKQVNLYNIHSDENNMDIVQ